MLHCIKYELISLLRNKIVVFWLLGFTIVLGTLFYAAFGNLADSEEAFSHIPVAVIEGDSPAEGLDAVLKSLSEGEDGLLDIKTNDFTQARQLLEKGEICGIIYSDENIKLELPEGTDIKSGIIRSVLDSFKSRQGIVTDVAENHPEKLGEVLEGITDETAAYIASSSNNANKDPYVQYFYNLLAMCGLLGSMMGMYCAINHQANLSALGARVEVSPMSKFKDIISSLAATLLVHNLFINMGAAYLVFILGIDFGVSFGFIVIINFMSTVIGNCMGCFIGSLGTMKDTVKNAILLAFSLGLCFCSGLMFGGMRLLIEENFPLFNRINPAALIVDCFYSLCVYDGYDRFIENTVILSVWCAALLAGSLIMTRRRKYKSI